MPIQRQILPVIGMHCANCSRSVQKALLGVQGVAAASVDLASERVEVTWDTEHCRPEDLAIAVRNAGFELVVPDALDDLPGREAAARDAALQRERRFVVLGVLCAVPILLLSMSRDVGLLVPMPGLDWLLFALATPVQFGTGWDYYRGAWGALKNRSPTMDVLVVLGSSAAYLYSAGILFLGTRHHTYFETAAIILVFVRVGKMLEARARHRSGAALEHLANLLPEQARLRTDDGIQREVPTRELRAGDVIVVRAGERIPVDGVVIEGTAFVDAASMTGESEPLAIAPGDTVLASSVNLDGLLVIRATQTGDDAMLARIIRLVASCQAGHAPIQRLADRVSALFVPVIVFVALATFVSWWLIGGAFEPALLRFVAVLWSPARAPWGWRPRPPSRQPPAGGRGPVSCSARPKCSRPRIASTGFSSTKPEH